MSLLKKLITRLGLTKATGDNFRIICGLLADFSTAKWGVLKLIDGKVVLDRVKAFNRARRMLNAGTNTFRILRRAVWGLPEGGEFDIIEVDATGKATLKDDPYYWMLLRDYVEILHQPVQGTPAGPGADVLIEIVDGCSEKWFLDPANLDTLRALVRAMFKYLGDLPYVKFGLGNELRGDREKLVAFHKNLYLTFKNAGRIPFSYGVNYSPEHLDVVDDVKQEAYFFWGDPGSFAIFKQVHGIKDEFSPYLLTTANYWINHPLCVFWSVDGVKDGDSICDHNEENTHFRPSYDQVKRTVRSILMYINKKREFAYRLITPEYKGQVRLGFEFITKVVNNDKCAAQGILAMSDAYFEYFGTYPANFGKYLDDWVEPTPPVPLVGVEVCTKTGLRPNHSCKKIQVIFAEGSEPQTVCQIHHDITIWEKIGEWLKNLFS